MQVSWTVEEDLAQWEQYTVTTWSHDILVGHMTSVGVVSPIQVSLGLLKESSQGTLSLGRVPPL